MAKTQAAQVAASTDAPKKPALPTTLETLQYLRSTKNASEKDIHARLDKALKECRAGEVELMLERVMVHIGDVSRQHNILKEAGIVSKTGGAQERKTFRSIMRWWEKNLPGSFEKNLRIFAEYTLYENLMYYQVTTDRKTGKLVEEEVLMPFPESVHKFLASQIRAGRDTSLIAKHLPKLSTGKNRKASFTIKAREGKAAFEWKVPSKEWVKIDGKSVTPGSTITVKGGEVVSYPRKKQEVTLKRQAAVNKWITGFCETMGWTTEQYKEFRSQQNTPEQKFSSGSITKMPKSDFNKMLDSLTSGQRFRVAKMLAFKEKNGTLTPREKWGNLGQWYIEWEKGQEKIADEIRKAAESGDKQAVEKLAKDFKVKATGKQTIDILKEMFEGRLAESQLNNTYQALIEKMDLVANVFPVIDGSGSMDSNCGVPGISRRQIAYAMGIAFSTRNPVDAFRNTYGWFSTNFHIVGHSKFKDTRPNRFIASDDYIQKGDAKPVISAGYTFTENYKRMLQSDPQDVSSTNMGVVIDTFIKLVEKGTFHVEELPQALLFITDNEHNTGDSPSKVLQRAYAIGWHPLVVFWGITGINDRMMAEFKKTPNCLLIGGFTEGVLSQILRGIKGGSVNPEDELWSIYEDKRYSLLS